MFRELKQQTGAFSYHFWSRHMPKLDRYQKETEPSPLGEVEDSHARKKILAAVRIVPCQILPAVQNTGNPSQGVILLIRSPST